jgi:hypothetical protein
MTINLSPYRSVQTGLFCRLAVATYKETPTSEPREEILRFSDFNRTTTINGEEYIGLGRLLGVTSSSSEIRTSGESVTITISGIPNISISEIVNSRIKGSPIEVWRVFFNPATGQQLAITGNPAGRFFGIVNNYSLQEDFDPVAKVSSNTIVLVCSSYVEVLNNKVVGRRTNSLDQKSFYPLDVSMDRVANLVGANFNFGAPR